MTQPDRPTWSISFSRVRYLAYNETPNLERRAMENSSFDFLETIHKLGIGVEDTIEQIDIKIKHAEGLNRKTASVPIEALMSVKMLLSVQKTLIKYLVEEAEDRHERLESLVRHLEQK